MSRREHSAVSRVCGLFIVWRADEFFTNAQSAFAMFSRTVALRALMLAVTFTRASAAEPKSAVNFPRDMAPILVQKWEVCHDAEKNKGHYQVTTFERLFEGWF